MICHHLAPNGEKSLLYQSLEQKYGPDKAHDAWEQVRSQQFLNRHGDWMAKDLFGSGRKVMELDANGEPTIGEVEKRLGLKPQFKAANAEQSTSIQQMQDFIRNGNPAQWFALEGKAGTGKTTIVQEALAPFIEEGKTLSSQPWPTRPSSYFPISSRTVSAKELSVPTRSHHCSPWAWTWRPVNSPRSLATTPHPSWTRTSL
jgi:hypothetical protein